MDVRPYVSQVQAQLAATAALGDDGTRRVAEALAVAAEPAVRLALIGSVTAAVDDITLALLDTTGAPTLAVRVDGDELRVELRPTEPEAPSVGVPDDENTARVSLRLPETFKERVEAAARHDGISVNSWLLRAAGLALSDNPGGGSRRAASNARQQRLTGWVNG